MSAPAPKRNPIPFGKYLLLDRINIGGMAEVWRGKAFGAGGFERLVAIKRILPNIAEDEEFTAMFIDEAKISVQLAHANIAQTYDLGQISGTYYIAMEYVAGRDLRAVFDRARKRKEMLPLPLVCHVMSKVCEGLDHAHRKKDGAGRDLNIVHRDVSPQNLLLSYDGEVKVIDFGIAKAAGRANKTQAGILKGKFGYMSPEQILGRPLDHRTDIFALGVCLHELLCGQRLFTGESDYSVLEKVRNVDIRKPSELNAEIPAALEAIVLRALAREPADRYAHASDMAEDLQRFLLTSGHYFGRKDLMEFMRTTFAEDLEKEEVRQLEYASVRPPPEFLARQGESLPQVSRSNTAAELLSVPQPRSEEEDASIPVPDRAEAPSALPRIGGGRRSPASQPVPTRSPRIGGGSVASGAYGTTSSSAVLASATPVPTSSADAAEARAESRGPAGTGTSGASPEWAGAPSRPREPSPTPREARSSGPRASPERAASAPSGTSAPQEPADEEAATLAMPTAFGLGADAPAPRFHMPPAQSAREVDSGLRTALDIRPVEAPETLGEAEDTGQEDTLPKGRPALGRVPAGQGGREEQRKTDPDLHGLVGQAARASAVAHRSISTAQLAVSEPPSTGRPVLVPLPSGLATGALEAPGEPQLTRADRPARASAAQEALPASPPRSSGAREALPAAPARSAAREVAPEAPELVARLRELFDAQELRHSRRDLWLAGLAGVVLAMLLNLLGAWFGGPPPTGLVLIDVAGVPAHLATVRVDGEALAGPLQFPMKAEVPVGRTRIEVSAAGFRPSAHEVEVASPGSVAEVRATLEPLTRNVP